MKVDRLAGMWEVIDEMCKQTRMKILKYTGRSVPSHFEVERYRYSEPIQPTTRA